MAESFAFESFVLDIRERRLISRDEPIELNGRYFDALTLLVSDGGKLISKDQFLDHVWRGVPVTDEALTQCIRTLRRALGDDASRPRFIETVPKHGYRFIAPVTVIEQGSARQRPERDETARRWQEFLVTMTAGIAGSAVAGVCGGLIYGFAAASQPAEAGPGSFSILLVLVSVTVLVGLIGAAGVSVGVAIARLARPSSLIWSAVGGASGGLLVGAFGKLLGLDAFTLLVGRSPGNITGAAEGALIGVSVGIAASLAMRTGDLRRGTAIAAVCGGSAGIVISALGGRLMLGSLELLASGFPNSRLHLDQISRPFANAALDHLAHVLDAAAEVGLFATCVVGAMMIARRRFLEIR